MYFQFLPSQARVQREYNAYEVVLKNKRIITGQLSSTVFLHFHPPDLQLWYLNLFFEFRVPDRRIV